MTRDELIEALQKIPTNNDVMVIAWPHDDPPDRWKLDHSTHVITRVRRLNESPTIVIETQAIE